MDELKNKKVNFIYPKIEVILGIVFNYNLVLILIFRMI